VRYLLDTHGLIWWWEEDPKLSGRARSVIADRRHQIFVSVVSAWEIATKVRAEKLPAMRRYVTSYDAEITAAGFNHLNVRQDHGIMGGLLKGEHRDPFDRLLAAQALIEGLTVITRDCAFATFGCEVLW
jgi:PIN domain nuclease of toxin-antitoxin system